MRFSYTGSPVSKEPCAEWLLSYAGKACSAHSHVHNPFQGGEEELTADCLDK